MQPCAYVYQRKERGGALLFALATVLILSVLSWGLATLATQHQVLAQRQKDYVAALDVAEAALNWELSKMSRLQYDPTIVIDGPPGSSPPPFSGPLPNAAPGPYVNGAPAILGRATVYVTDVGFIPYPWTPRYPFKIYASGTVNGVTRTIQAGGAPVFLSDLYTLYGVNQLAINSGSTYISGDVGTAGTATVTPGATLQGTAVINAPDPTAAWVGTLPSWDWLAAPSSTPLPTIDKAAFFTLGISDPIAYFKTHNDNDTWIKVRDTTGALHPVQWKDSNGNPLPHDQITPELFAANKHPAPGKTMLSLVLMGNPTKPVGSSVPLGSNFYLEKLQLPANGMLEIQNGSEVSVSPSLQCGAVRIWLGPKDLATAPPAQKFELIDGTLLLRDDSVPRIPPIQQMPGAPDPRRFWIYQGSRTPLRLGGRLVIWDNSRVLLSPFAGCIYGYNYDSSTGQGWGTVQLEGSLSLKGSIVAWNLVQDPNSQLSASGPGPPSASPDLQTFILYYRLNSAWVETGRLSASRGTQ
jgi:hypothetical protein